MATHVLRIPELGNAELKLTVVVERIQPRLGKTESLADAPAALPGFAQLRPIRVDIYLGGEHVYHWARDSVLIEEPERVKTHPLPADGVAAGGAAPANRRR